MNEFNELIGEGTGKLTLMQMGIRAALIFLAALILIRFSGRRAFGQRSPFDTVIAILLGAILGRSILETDISFFGSIIAASVICVLHFVFALITTNNHLFGKLVKGGAKILYKDGVKNKRHMKGSFISDKDLEEGIRKAINTNDMSKVKEAWLERDGSISVIKKE